MNSTEMKAKYVMSSLQLDVVNIAAVPYEMFPKIILCNCNKYFCINEPPHALKDDFPRKQ